MTNQLAHLQPRQDLAESRHAVSTQAIIFDPQTIHSMMQMAEMRDAQAGNLENEDRIAERAELRPKRAQISGHVAHPDIIHENVVHRLFARLVGPAAQHVFDAWIGVHREVGRMRPVHRRDPRHLGGDGAGGEALYRVPVSAAMDGNTVEPAVEQLQFAENTMRQQASLTLLNRRISGLMSAIKGE